MNISIKVPIQGVQMILSALGQSKDGIDSLIKSIVEQSNAQIQSANPPPDSPGQASE